MHNESSKLLKCATLGVLTFTAGIVPSVAANIEENLNNHNWIGGTGYNAVIVGDQRWDDPPTAAGSPAPGFGVTSVYGGTTVVDTGVTIGGDSIDASLLPTIEVNSGSAAPAFVNKGTIYSAAVNVLVGTLTNESTATITAIQDETAGTTGLLTNNTSVYNSGSISAAINNNGVITGVQTGVDADNNPVYAYGKLTITGDSTNSGTITQDTITLDSDITLINDGSIKANTKIVNDGTITNNTSGIIDAAVIENNNKITNNGLLKTVITNTLSGTVDGSGTIEMIADSNNTGTILQSVIVDEGVTFDNLGKIGTNRNTQVKKVTNNGTLNNNGDKSTVQIWAEEIENSGEFNNSARINASNAPAGKFTNKTGGTFNVNTDSNVNINEFIAETGSTASFLVSKDFIIGSIDNSGTINVGNDTLAGAIRNTTAVMTVTNNEDGTINVINGKLGVNETTLVQIDNSGSIVTTAKGEINATSITNQESGDITIEGTSHVQSINNSGELNIGTDSEVGVIRHTDASGITTITNNEDGTINVVNGTLGMSGKTSVSIDNAGTVNNSTNGTIYATNITNSGEFNNEGLIARAVNSAVDTYIDKITNETGGEFNNNGTIWVNAIENETGGTFVNQGTLQSNATDGHIDITNAGEFQNSQTLKAVLTNSGVLTGVKTYDSDGNVTSTTYGDLILTDDSTNSGTIFENSITVNKNVKFDSTGYIGVSSDGSVTQAINTITNNGTFNQTGGKVVVTTLNNNADATLTSNIGDFRLTTLNNEGTINTNRTFNVTGEVNNTGEINLQYREGSTSDNRWGTLNNEGTVTVAENANAAITTINNKSTGIIENSGKIGGTKNDVRPVTKIDNQGTITNNATGSIYAAEIANSNIINNAGNLGDADNKITTLTNSGTINNNQGGYIYATTITNNNELVNNIDARIYAETLTNNNTLDNNSSINVTNFTNVSGASVTNTSGGGRGNIYMSGTSSNSGTITQNRIENSGTLENKRGASIESNHVVNTNYLKNEGGATITTHSSMTNSSEIFNNGTISATNLNNQAGAKITGNAYDGSYWAQTLNIQGNNSNNAGLIEQAVVNVTSGTFNNNNGGAIGANTVTNSGTLNNDLGAKINTGTLTNNSTGTIYNTGNLGTSDNYITTLTNNGTINNNSGGIYATGLTNNKSLDNNGTVYATNFTNVSGASVTNSSGSNFGILSVTGNSSNEGTISQSYINNSGTFKNNGTMSATGSGIYNAAGAAITNDWGKGTLNTNGGTNRGIIQQTAMTVTGGSFSNDGSAGGWSNGCIQVSNLNVNSGASFTNASSSRLYATGTVTNNGTITNNSSGTYDGMHINTVNNYGSLVNNGKIAKDDSVSSATINNGYNGRYGTITNNSNGTITVNQINNQTSSNTIHNYGTIASAINNYGTIDGTGNLTLTGNSTNQSGAKLLQDKITVNSGVTFDNNGKLVGSQSGSNYEKVGEIENYGRVNNNIGGEMFVTTITNKSGATFKSWDRIGGSGNEVQTLTNESGGTFRLLGSNAQMHVKDVINQGGAVISVETNGNGMRTQTITNAGQIDIGNISTGVGGSQTTGIVYVSEKLTNTGVINVDKGYLGQDRDKVIPTVENSGTINVATEGTMYAANITNSGNNAALKVSGRLGDKNYRANITNSNGATLRTLGETAKLYGGNLTNSNGSLMSFEGEADITSLINRGLVEVGSNNVAGTVIGAYVENFTVIDVKNGTLGVGEEDKMVTLTNYGTVNVQTNGEIYAGSITNKANNSTDITVINNNGNISAGGINNYATVNNESGAEIHAQNFRNYSEYNNKAGSHSYLVALQNGGADTEGNTYTGTVNNDGYIISAIKNEVGSTISGTGNLTVNNTNKGTENSIDSYNKGSITGLSQIIVDSGAKLTNEGSIGTNTSKISSMTVKGEFANNSASGVYATEFINEGKTTSTGRFGDAKNRIQTLTNKGTFTQNGNSNTKSYVFANEMVNEGTYTNNTGDLDVTTLTNKENATLTNKKKLVVADSVDNSGKLELTGTGYMTAKSITNNSTGEIVNAGKIGYAGNTNTVTPLDTFTNNGGKVTNTGEIYVNDLTNELSSYINGSGKIEMSGTSSNSGVIEGYIVNSGTLTNMRDIGKTDSPDNTVIVNSGTIISTAEKVEDDDNTFNTAIYAKSFTNNNTDDARGTVNVRKLHVTELVENYGDMNVDFQLGEREDSDSNISKYKIDNVVNHEGANITIGSTTGRTDAEIVANNVRNDGTITTNQNAYIDNLTNNADFTNNGSNIQLKKWTNTKNSRFTLNNGKIGSETIIDLQKGSYTVVTNSNEAGVQAELTLDSSDKISGIVENNGGKLTLQGVKTESISGIINQNYGDLALIQAAKYTLTSNTTINGGNLLIDNSTLKTAAYPSLTVDSLALNSATINMQNGDISTINASDMSAEGTNKLIVEMDAREQITDAIVVSGDSIGSGTFHVADYRFIGKAPIEDEIKFQIVDVQGNLDENMNFSVVNKAVDTPIGRYSLVSNGGGLYSAKIVGLNPQVFRGQATTLAAYNTQLMIDDLVLSHIPLESEHALIVSKNDNKYAISNNSMFGPYHHSKEEGGLWYKTYVDFETLSMTHGLKINNNAYGSVIGADLPMKHLKNGWKYIGTPYIIYHGAAQSFNGVHAYHNGGQGGFMSNFMRGDFTGGITAYGGGYASELHVADTTDNSGNWFAGVATKASYNLRATDHFTVQPTLFASYNAFGRQKWHSDYGDMTMRSGMMNGVNVAPGVNLIYARDTWSLYLTLKYMYNINDQVSGRAGTVDLPNVSMRHGYFEYGIGGSKIWKDRFSSYAQFVIRNGGRTGIGMQLGMQYFFGSRLNEKVQKDNRNEVKVSNKTTKVKAEKVQRVKVEKEKVQKVKAQKEVKVKSVAPKKEPVAKQKVETTTVTKPSAGKMIIKQLPQ